VHFLKLSAFLAVFAPEKRPKLDPKKESSSSSNHPFFRAKTSVSGRVLGGSSHLGSG